jgi:uncharacterized membrane protein YuzA (DUF378 family)
MKNLNVLDWIALILVIVGGLNWGLVGIFSFNLVDWIFGGVYFIARIIYILVALAAIYMVIIAATLKKK